MAQRNMVTTATVARAKLLFLSVIALGGAARAAEPGAAADVQLANIAQLSQGSLSSPNVAAATDLADKQFRSLFLSWKKLDAAPGTRIGGIAIPSVQPVQHLAFTSNFGIRTDPFQGTARMHAGVDIPGPVGTPVYATADGTVDEAQRAGGYGNMIEIDHGKGIATRYGHLSKILVASGTHVTRGELIGLMGSTGRSTGPHLHYEVRIDGKAVNPAPFLTSTDYLIAAQDHAVHAIPVSTGPAAQD